MLILILPSRFMNSIQWFQISKMVYFKQGRRCLFKFLNCALKTIFSKLFFLASVTFHPPSITNTLIAVFTIVLGQLQKYFQLKVFPLHFLFYIYKFSCGLVLNSQKKLIVEESTTILPFTVVPSQLSPNETF